MTLVVGLLLMVMGAVQVSHAFEPRETHRPVPPRPVVWPAFFLGAGLLLVGAFLAVVSLGPPGK